MARTQITCKCGWVFFVADGSEGRCPSCGNTTAAPAPAKKTARRVAQSEEPEAGDSKKVLVLCGAGGGAVLLLVVLYFAFAGGTPKPIPPSEGPSAFRSPPPVPAAPTTTPRTADPGPAMPRPPDKPRTSDTPKPPEAPKLIDLPPAVVVGVQTKVLALPAYYLDKCVTPAERARIDALLSAGRGTDVDASFLSGLPNRPSIGLAGAEVAMIAAAIPDLEVKAPAELAPDRITLTDGRAFDCRILEESAAQVKAERRIGTGVSVMTLKREEVKDLGKGKGAGTDALQRLEKARKGGPPELMSLALWSKDQGLATLRALACHLILQADPGNEVARGELGLKPFTGDAAAPVAPTPGADGPMVSFEGKDWPARELKAKLLKDGYVIIKGQWYGRKERVFAAPGLWKWEKLEKKPLDIIGEQTSNFDTVFKTRPNAAGTIIEEEVKTFTHKFFTPPMIVTTITDNMRVLSMEREEHVKHDEGSPKPGDKATAEVVVAFKCEAPVIEAKIKALAEVEFGAIECFLEVDGARLQVFRAQKKEDRTHKLPDAIRGKSDVRLVFTIMYNAQYNSRKERRVVQPLKYGPDKKLVQKEIIVVHDRLIPNYTTRLFPSNSNTIEIFRANVVVAELSIGLNKAFEQAGAMDMLKE